MMLAFFTFVFVSLAYVAADGIPVLLWTNKENVHYPVLLRGPALGSTDFSRGYLDQTIEKEDQNLVVFVQDQLSLNDITNYADVFSENSDGAVFSSLKKAMETFESTHIAKVKQPVHALKRLQRNFKGKVHIVDNVEDLDEVSLDNEAPNMVVINLQNVEHLDRKRLLKQSDEVIGKLTGELANKARPFTAIYTANEESKVVSPEHGNVGRHLLAAPATTNTTNNNYTFFKVTADKSGSVQNCVFFYFTSFKLQVIQVSRTVGPNYDNHTIYDFPSLFNDTSAVSSGSTCANNTATLMLDYKGNNLPNGLTKFTMKMTFHNMSGFWSVNEWDISFAGKNKSDNTEFGKDDWGMENENSTLYGTLPYANNGSRGYSYHCGEQIITQANSTVLTTTDLVVQLIFREFQLQYNLGNNTKFGPPNECVGFFTGGVWMTLIFFAVALLILSFGVSLLASIQTMDRFDDPKGKAIQVNVSE